MSIDLYKINDMTKMYFVIYMYIQDNFLVDRFTKMQCRERLDDLR